MFMLYFESNQGRLRERRYIYSDIHQNAPFRSKFSKKNFASGGKGALTALTKILRTFLLSRDKNCGPRLVNLLRVVL